MSDQAKKFVVEVDVDTYSVIEEFCEQMNEEDQSVVEYLLNQSLSDFVTTYNNLKQGYMDYGHMNLEISDAFTATENEAYSHIEDY